MNWKEFYALEDRFKAGETIFVRFTSGAREGSIGKLVTFESWSEVGWDNRPNTVKVHYLNFEFANVTSTHWVFERNKVVEPVVVTDSLGQPFNVGDIVLYRSKKTNYFGLVEEVKPTGGIYVKRSGIINSDYKVGKVERIIDRMDAIIISDNIRNVLMRKKLSML